MVPSQIVGVYEWLCWEREVRGVSEHFWFLWRCTRVFCILMGQKVFDWKVHKEPLRQIFHVYSSLAPPSGKAIIASLVS